MGNCGTTKCITCGKDAILYGGYLKTKAGTKVLAGFCSDGCYSKEKSDKKGCFGGYQYEYGLIDDILKR